MSSDIIKGTNRRSIMYWHVYSLKVSAAVFQEYFSDMPMPAAENDDGEQYGMDYKVCFFCFFLPF